MSKLQEYKDLLAWQLDPSVDFILKMGDDPNEPSRRWEAAVAVLTDIFDLITYDSAMDLNLVGRMVEVCRAIVNRKTYEFQMTEEGYKDFITIVQFKWFSRKLNWGVSIRNAWFDNDYSGDGVRPVMLHDGCLFMTGSEKQFIDPVMYTTKEEIEEFVKALIWFYDTEVKDKDKS